jgi:hypothetical protein
MKKNQLFAIIILAVILFLPAVNFIRWFIKSKKPLDIILIDKTVPTLGRENHRSLSWVLTNERFVKKETNSGYSYKRDYYGFFPLRPVSDHKWEKNDIRLNDLLILADKNDAVYFADAAGVFFDDWYRGINKPRKSRKIYGGLNNNDFLLVKEMKDRNKLIIMEYNTFDWPTAQFESVRIQEKLGVKFTGWTGRYFASLDSTSVDFPEWITATYRKEHNKPWTFEKSGIILLTQKNILVLEEGKQLKSSYPTIITKAPYREKYGVDSSVVFDNWFDIVDPVESNVISNFRLETTPLGDTLLSSNGLPNEFPAVLQESLSPNVFYFSGNFAYSAMPMWTSRFLGIDKLKGVLYSGKTDDARRFFWFYYKPLINGILTDYYASKNKIIAIDK